jgi:hypothetical protein
MPRVMLCLFTNYVIGSIALFTAVPAIPNNSFFLVPNTTNTTTTTTTATMSPLPDVLFDVARNPVLAGRSSLSPYTTGADSGKWAYPLVSEPSAVSLPAGHPEATGTL